MRYLFALGAMFVLALSINVCADDASSSQTPQVTAGEEQSDFSLLTPITEAQSQEVRGELDKKKCVASYAQQVSSAIAAAQCFLDAYRSTNGHPTGSIIRNPDLTWTFTGCID